MTQPASHVATLLVCPGTVLSECQIAAVTAALPRAEAPVWLCAGTVADVPFAPPPGGFNAPWAAAVHEALAGAPADVVVQPRAGRRKRLLLADMDSTLIEQECIDELADAVGLRDRVSAITGRSMRGEVSFEASLLERVALLKGLDVGLATRLVGERIALMPGAATLVRTMRAHGAFTAIASGGFTLFTAHVASLLGMDRHYANTLTIERGRLAGGLELPIFGPAAKRATLRALRNEFHFAPEATMAVGDGANDIPMLEEAGLGVAFRAKPAVAAVATARIDHGDLTALLYLQGYAAHEFVAHGSVAHGSVA